MKIIILMGSPNRKGSTSILVEAFTRGAEKAGHSVECIDVCHADIHPCIGCVRCGYEGPCVQKDDVESIRQKLLSSDMVVFATPLYYYGMSAQLKTVVDRFCAYNSSLNSRHLKSALLTVAWNADDWSNETTTLGTPESPNRFKNVIDHAIQDRIMQPMIIVCPTYNNTNENGQDSDSFSLAMQLNRQLYHETFNDLLPAVEGKYSTFAENTTPEGLKASREHRGFGGFSMGSVATWRTFEHGGIDYFYYFMPMSCGTSMDDDDVIQAAAENADPTSYFIWVMTGTGDFAFSYDNGRANRMRNTEWFTEAGEDTDGNFTYYVKGGYGRDGIAANEYTFNGLCWFWNHE